MADLDGDGRWVLYGVNSFGNGCGNSWGLYDGYEEVSQHVNTILSKITY